MTTQLDRRPRDFALGAALLALLVTAFFATAVVLKHQAGVPAASGRWSSLPASPLAPHTGPTAVWTGSEMVIWGGLGHDGGAYDPARHNWRHLPPAPLAGRDRHTSVWTGHEVIVWGGIRDDGRLDLPQGLDDGAAYDPQADVWRKLPQAPLPGRWSHQAVWTGREMIVWGGATGDEPFDGGRTDGAAYDPRLDRWRPIASAPPDNVLYRRAVWTGTTMIVVGGLTGEAGGQTRMAPPLAYDPERDVWSRLPAINLPVFQAAVVWTGREMIVYGRLPPDRPGGPFAGGAAYDPVLKRWRRLPRPPRTDVQNQFSNTSYVWTGHELLLWGGRNHEALAYRPHDDRWLRLPPAPIPDREVAPAVWTGNEMIIWGGREIGGFGRAVLSGAAYSPPGYGTLNRISVRTESPPLDIDQQPRRVGEGGDAKRPLLPDDKHPLHGRFELAEEHRLPDFLGTRGPDALSPRVRPTAKIRVDALGGSGSMEADHEVSALRPLGRHAPGITQTCAVRGVLDVEPAVRHGTLELEHRPVVPSHGGEADLPEKRASSDVWARAVDDGSLRAEAPCRVD